MHTFHIQPARANIQMNKDGTHAHISHVTCKDKHPSEQGWHTCTHFTCNLQGQTSNWTRMAHMHMFDIQPVRAKQTLMTHMRKLVKQPAKDNIFVNWSAHMQFSQTALQGQKQSEQYWYTSIGFDAQPWSPFWVSKIRSECCVCQEPLQAMHAHPQMQLA